MISSDRRRRRRAVDGEQLLALGARRAKTRRAKEDGVGRAAVVLIVDSVASPPAVADFPALQFHKEGHDVCGPAAAQPFSSASARSWSGHADAAAASATTNFACRMRARVRYVS